MNYQDIYTIMNDFVSEKESVLAQQIIKEAFNNAAKSFSIFTRKKVSIEIVSYNNILLERENYNLMQSQQHVFVSELKGDIKGKCYLIFDNESADKVYQLSLNRFDTIDEEMREALLLELDNILTASVVTVLSNKLALDSYAYVPMSYYWSGEHITNTILNDLSVGRLLFNFNTKFTIEEESIRSEFIWVMELKFVDKIIQSIEN